MSIGVLYIGWVVIGGIREILYYLEREQGGREGGGGDGRRE